MLHHVCKICGKEFASPKGVGGHMRTHSGKRIRDLKQLEPDSSSIEQREMNEAALNFVMFCEQAYDPLQRAHTSKESSFMTEVEQHELNEAALSLEMLSQRLAMYSELRTMSIHCAETKQEFGHETSGTDVVVPLRSYNCKICAKSFKSYHALGGHKRSHSLITGQSERIKKASGARKVVCVESKQEFLFGHETSATCYTEVVVPLRSNSSYNCKICGKSFKSYHALGGHKRSHSLIRGQSERIKKDSGARKVVCVESNQDFSELFSYSGFENITSTCSDVNLGVVPAMNGEYATRVLGVVKL